MALELRPPVSSYFDARNAHDAVGTADLFAPDGRVHDERNDHRGQQAIERWAEQTSAQYRMIQTPRSAHDDGEATSVIAQVAGDFPGSPIDLTFRFVLDGGKIRDLKIG